MGGTQADISYWSGGSGDGAWGTAGNWATHSGSPTTTIPSAGESVLFDDRAATSVTAGLDQSALSIAGFASKPGFRFSIGTTAAPLQIDVDHTNSAAVTPYCRIQGMGTFTKLSGAITEMTSAFSGAGILYIAGGTVTNPIFAGGRVIVEAGGLIARASGSGAAVVAAGNVTVRQHAGTSTSDVKNLSVFGGELNLFRNTDVLTVAGAGSTARILTDATIDTRLDQYGGTVSLNSSGTIVRVNGYAGVATTQGATRDFIITDQTLYLNTHTMTLDAAPVTVTESNAAVENGFKGIGA